jgi:hypothetical protein
MSPALTIAFDFDDKFLQSLVFVFLIGLSALGSFFKKRADSKKKPPALQKPGAPVRPPTPARVRPSRGPDVELLPRVGPAPEPVRPPVIARQVARPVRRDRPPQAEFATTHIEMPSTPIRESQAASPARRIRANDQISRMIAGGESLGAAFALAEILAPPVALRENHLF